MMRNLLGMAAVLCLLAFQVQAADEKKPDDKSDKDKLQGTWVLAGVEIDGKPIDIPKDSPEMTFTFKDDKATMKEDKKIEEGTYKLDEKKNPKEIDIIHPKKDNPKEMETEKWIYKLDGDTLKLATSGKGPSGSRPKNFDENVMILKRKK